MIDLTIPEAISSGKKMRLKGRGIPAKQPGDFYVILEIVLPDSIGDKEKALYKELQQASSHFNPRAKLGLGK
jgi:curved DNA-binding protein